MNRKLISVLSGFGVLIITYLLSTLIMSQEDETYNKNTNIVHSVRAIKTSNTSNAFLEEFISTTVVLSLLEAFRKKNKPIASRIVSNNVEFRE